MENVNGQLNAAKAGFEQGAQLAQSGEIQVTALKGQLKGMYHAVRKLRNTDLTATTEGLGATIAVARDSNGEAIDVLRGTFEGENTWDLNSHIRRALATGDEAHRYLVEGERVGLAPPIGLEEMQQRIGRIGQQLVALFQEVEQAYLESDSLAVHLNTTARASNSAVNEIAAYQQENNLPQ